MAVVNLVCASRVTQLLAMSIFVYELVVYNSVYLGRVLPVLGKQALVPPFAVLFNACWLMAAWSYLRAHFSDPGRLPEQWLEFVRRAGDSLPVVPARPEWQPGRATWCKKCAVARPERSHHCLICGVCVLRMDHHCPWINNCVGLRNHKFFLLLGIYALLSSLVALSTALPDLPFAMGVLANGPSDREPLFSEHGGVVAVGSIVDEGTMTVQDAKRRCVALPGCRAFSFEGRDPAREARVVFKDRWGESSGGGLSYMLREHAQLESGDALLFALCVMLAAMVALMLTPMLATHLPLALQNLTTIEDNYDNMPNPFDRGSMMANLEQTIGKPGPDWLLPLEPWHPLTDGVSFTRSDEHLGPDGLPEGLAGLEQAELWRKRYHVRSAVDVAEGLEMGTVLSSLTRWWTGS